MTGLFIRLSDSSVHNLKTFYKLRNLKIKSSLRNEKS